MALKTVVTVLGRDRNGIVAAVATALAESGANIDDIQQTTLDDIFAMTMLCTLDESASSFNEVHGRLTELGEQMGLQIKIQRQDIFDAMYTV